MAVLNLGVLLHPGHDDFEREQAGPPDMLCDELMDENEQQHIAGHIREKFKNKCFSASCALRGGVQRGPV